MAIYPTNMATTENKNIAAAQSFITVMSTSKSHTSLEKDVNKDVISKKKPKTVYYITNQRSRS